jgi:hypothetical protein
MVRVAKASLPPQESGEGMGITDSEPWIPTRRTNAQIWVFLAISLPFVLSAVYLFATSGFPAWGGFQTWTIPAAVLLIAYFALELYVVNSRRPRGIRITPANLEVRTLFGGLVKVPRETARITESWPTGFGNLNSPALRAWVSLDPVQFASVQAAAKVPLKTVGEARIQVEESPASQMQRYADSVSRLPIGEAYRVPGFMRTPLGRPVGWACLYFVPFVGALTAFVLWLNASSPGYFGPSWVLWTLIAFMVLLAALIVWFVGVGLTTLGIAIDNEGVTVLDRAIRRGIALRRTLPWDSIRNPRLVTGKQVWIDGDAIGTSLTYDQARTVLLDQRCPLRERLPDELRRAIVSV